MIENVEQDRQDNFKAEGGIGLYKVRYEMDVENSKRDQSYIAGVIAYTSKEAVDSLIEFAKVNVKGFKGMRVDEVSFDGAVHALSDTVRSAILNTAKAEGALMGKEDHEKALEGLNAELKKAEKEIKKLKKDGKKSIIPEA